MYVPCSIYSSCAYPSHQLQDRGHLWIRPWNHCPRKHSVGRISAGRNTSDRRGTSRTGSTYRNSVPPIHSVLFQLCMNGSIYKLNESFSCVGYCTYTFLVVTLKGNYSLTYISNIIGGRQFWFVCRFSRNVCLLSWKPFAVQFINIIEVKIKIIKKYFLNQCWTKWHSVVWM